MRKNKASSNTTTAATKWKRICRWDLTVHKIPSMAQLTLSSQLEGFILFFVT
jgi:hypothetical protein